MPSWHPLTPRWLRFAILAALASEAGSRGTVSPSLSSCLVDGAGQSLAGFMVRTEQPDRRHAQKPVSLVDAGHRHSVGASNSHTAGGSETSLPPAPSMPPAGCGAATTIADHVQTI
jgi:hypothetical protein